MAKDKNKSHGIPSRIPELVRSLWSSEALTNLYSRRRSLSPSDENRTKVSLFISGTLFIGIMSFLMAMAWMRHDTNTFLDGREGIEYLDANAWTASSPVPEAEFNQNNIERNSITDLSSLRTLKLPPSNAIVELQTELSIDVKSRFDSHNSAALKIPHFYFRKAEVFLDNNLIQTFFDSQPLVVFLDTRAENPRLLSIRFTLDNNQEIFSLVGRDGNSHLDDRLAIMPSHDWYQYRNFLATNAAGRGNTVGAIARIVMAVFVLALFLIIDGSPESLGLGLFLGFEAFAITTSYNWLPLKDVEFIRHYCYQMGDIFRLYFFLQMARMIDKRVGNWLFWATVVSVPYGLLRYYAPQFEWTWVKYIPRNRDLIIGLIGTAVCLRAAWFLRDKQLPWRVVALTIAGLAAFEQSIEPLVAGFFPFLQDHGWYRAVLDTTQPLSVWMLAFSAFINISTMENRIKVLSQVEIRAKEIQHEMELGRTVQRAFHHIPKLPKGVKVTCHHEAMLYVSGDTYYVNHNPQSQQICFLINDVTGHGIQAALKASAASVIAKSMWNEEQSSWNQESLMTYDQQVQSFLSQMADVPDVVAMGGGFFDLKEKALYLYRANFPFPIIIQPTTSLTELDGPHLGELWQPLANRETML
jgi:hypothetical protein